MKIAVVGHCGSGKSTVVKLLKRWGYDAYSVAQEHSIIDDLWNHQEPDHVVYLGVSLPEIRKRKSNPQWPDWIFQEQVKRLDDARSNASISVDTDNYSAEEVADIIVQQLNQE